MEPTTKQLGVLAAAALALGVAILVASVDPTGKPYDAPADAVGGVPVLTRASVGDLASYSKLAVLDDGGTAAYVELPDGGLALLDLMPCVRKPKGGACTLLDGGDAVPWNRFRAGELTGAQCEPVPCSVKFGDESEPP